jgi:hypothetical protein
MKKMFFFRIVLLLLISSHITFGQSENQKKYETTLRLEKGMDAGSTILGFGIAGTTGGVGMLIIGNIVKNRNGPGLYESYSAAQEAKRKYEAAEKVINASVYFYGIGIPMIVGGAIMRGVFKRKLRDFTGFEYSLDIGLNSITLNGSF